MGLRRRHALDTVGTHAVHAIRRHTDASHAEVLALIDELIALGPAAQTARGQRHVRTRAVASL
jgi:DNA-binding sugar fermentation-stimulating protein